MRMNSTLVINSKGGSGKTTIATNLASYFAAQNIPTTIMDYDPQGSSLHWLRARPGPAARIYGANAAPQKGGRIRSVEMHVPADTQQLVIDAPAGTSGLLLQEMLGRADGILIPVAPSAIDIDRKSTRLNSSHTVISYAVFCLKKKKETHSRHEQSVAEGGGVQDVPG